MRNKPEVMVLGTFHFQGSLDVVQNNSGDLMTEEKQREINEVLEKISAFKPTKIAVEVEKIHNETLNQNYQEYRNHSFHLTANEVHQLGFKLGKKLNIETISAVDWMEKIGNRSIDEVLKWAESHQPDLYKKIMNDYISKLEMGFNHLTVLEILKQLNENRGGVPLDHQAYMQIARIGNEHDSIGIDWVRWWYQRNLILYKNVLDLIKDENERVLLIIGSGHRYLIQQFLAESGEVTIKNPTQFLN